MKIIIVGAGRVGESVARNLASEKNEITIIDPKADLIALVQSQIDLRGIVGNAVEPSILKAAGAGEAQMMIACASAAETNLVVCKLAHDLFKIPTTVARISYDDYQNGSEILRKDGGFAVDYVICPEKSVTNYIHELIDHPEALQVLKFAEGLLSLVAVRAVADSVLARHTIAEIPSLIPNIQMRIVAIYRDGGTFIYPDQSTQIQPGDEVFLLAPKDHIHNALGAIHDFDRPIKRIMIAGGGRVGYRLAKTLSKDHQVKILEGNKSRCEYLSAELSSKVIVLHGNSNDENILVEENINSMDLFLSLTSNDQDNIMSSLLAKKLGARRVITLINRKSYAELIEGSQIDIAISPASTIIGELLAYVRRGDVEAVPSLRGGAAEALEGLVRGDQKNSQVIGKLISEINLPEGAQIGAIVRGRHLPDGRLANLSVAQIAIIFPEKGTRIEPWDHLVIFLPNRRSVHAVEKLLNADRD